MKILLDENIPTKVKFDFGKAFEIKTVRDMGWLGKKNGELLKLMTSNDFDFFITLDKHLRNQQHLVNYNINIILLFAENNKHQTVQLFVNKIEALILSGQYQKFNEIR